MLLAVPIVLLFDDALPVDGFCLLSDDAVNFGAFGSSVEVRLLSEEDVFVAGLPNFGLTAGAAKESGCANFRSFTCLISNLFSPFLNTPTSILTVDFEGQLSTLKGPS